MRPQNFLGLLILCLVLSGCATRKTRTFSPASLDGMPVSQSFTEQVAALPEGSVQYFAESPMGPSTVDAGSFYSSGLGHECRSARISNENMSHRIAICREENGPWRFIPTIFESMPR